MKRRRIVMSERTELTKQNESAPEQGRELPTVAPIVDIYENENEILLYADMPGVPKEDIRVNVDNGKLTLSGGRKVETAGETTREEFASVEYFRVFSVPQTIAVDKVNAELKDGVLHLHLPKSESAKPRQIEIKAG
jgi:HSP20 family protein